MDALRCSVNGRISPILISLSASRARDRLGRAFYRVLKRAGKDERKMSRRHEQNEARARLIIALWNLSQVNPYHGLTAEEVLTEILDEIEELEQTARGDDLREAASQAAAMWWDMDWCGDAEAERAWDEVVDAAEEVLRCRGRC